MAADCGEFVSAGPEFNPNLVAVPTGDCTVTPQEVEPPEEVSLTATVRNRNEMSARATVEWTWLGRSLATTEVTVGSNGRETVEARATIEREGRDQVRAEVIDELELTGRQPATAIDERVQAGAPEDSNGQHRPVADGGVEAAGTPTRAAIARLCGGCAERSRKLSRTNRRLRDVFDVFGRDA